MRKGRLQFWRDTRAEADEIATRPGTIRWSVEHFDHVWRVWIGDRYIFTTPATPRRKDSSSEWLLIWSSVIRATGPTNTDCLRLPVGSISNPIETGWQLLALQSARHFRIRFIAEQADVVADTTLSLMRNRRLHFGLWSLWVFVVLFVVALSGPTIYRDAYA